MKKQKKIVMLTHYFYPHLGGVEKHVLQTALGLRERGYAVEIIAAKHSGQDISSKQKTYPSQVKGLPVYWLDYPRFKFLGLIWIWLKMMFLMPVLKQAEIIHVHDVFIWYLPFRFLLPEKKVVTTMHGWEGVFPIPVKYIFLKKLAARFSEQVVCVGSYIEKYYQLKADEVIYGAIDESWKLNQELISEKHQPYSPKINLLFVGRLEEDTGLNLLLAAIDLLPAKILDRFEINFAGGGPLKKKCSDYGEILGWLSKKELQIKLKESQLCFAGGYLAALEAMASGCVVLAGYSQQLKRDYWQLREMGRRVLAGGASDLEKIIIDYVNTPSRLVERVKSNWIWSCQQSWQRVCELYEQLYVE